MSKKPIACAIPNVPEIEAFERCAIQNTERYECGNESREVGGAIKSLGYKFLGAGVSRSAYGLGKCVVKVAQAARSSLANKAEWEMWNSVVKANHPLKKILLPIYAVTPNYTVLLVPKASVGTDDDVVIVRGKLLDAGFACFDIKPGNVGRIGKKSVLLDYGFGLDCRARSGARVQTL